MALRGEKMDNEYKISVRALVEYVFSSGSIESGFRTATSLTEGTRAHIELQKDYQESDQREVPLHTTLPLDGISLHIDGRADGILFRNGEVTVDEIKSTAGRLSLVNEDTYPVHWAQAEFYAYMYAKDHEISAMNIQLTYKQVQTGEVKRFAKKLLFKELEESIHDLASRFVPFARLRLTNIEKRNRSINELSFPFEDYRKGQRMLAGAVYKTALEKKTLFAQAPTGIGKTISTIFPSVKAIGEGLINKIFYLTAKTITRQAAEEAFRLIEEKGLFFQYVTITAKEKVCLKDHTVCTKEHCEFADGYYDRINGAVLDILENETRMDRETIVRYSRKHRVCPFEFSLDLAYVSDAVVCDYNYVFDPRVSIKRYSEEYKKENVLLVDEAHNLVDRGREMYSASLNKAPFLQIRRQYKEINGEIYEISKKLNDFFISIRKQAGSEKTMVLKDTPKELNGLADQFISECELELLQGKEEDPLLLEAFFAVQNWIRIGKLYSEEFTTYCEISNKDVSIRQFCLDPSRLVRKYAKSFRSRVYFSATFTPLDYYLNMLGGGEEDYKLTLPSPFVREQNDVRICPLSTRYRDRDRSILPIVRTISNLVHEKPGNYLVFFPSYQYMSSVLEKWEGAGIETLIQGTGMDEREREAFLENFSSKNEVSLVGFAVLGGIFSEGIDLKGDRLNGVVIVGVGLPQIGFERDLIKGYFAEKGMHGYDYAYVYPGMNKVLQAGGRLIRSENDRGTIMLIDDRFLLPKYQQLIPNEWMDYKIIN